MPPPGCQAPLRARLTPLTGPLQRCLPPFLGIPTDHVLPNNPTCKPLIERYAADQRLFFADFATAFAKLTELGVQWR